MPALNRCIPAIRKSDTLEKERAKLRVPTLDDFERVPDPAYRCPDRAYEEARDEEMLARIHGEEGRS